MPINIKNDALYTVSEASKETGISVDQLRKAINNYVLLAYKHKRTSKAYYIKGKDLYAYLTAYKVANNIINRNDMLYTVSEASEETGISVDQLRKAINKGDLLAYKNKGTSSKICIKHKDLYAYLVIDKAINTNKDIITTQHIQE